MDAAAMSLGLHGCGIHAVWSGAGEAGVTKARFRCMPRAMARSERAKINSS
jgi:gamma-glutamylcysteine synthetase